MRNLLIVSLVIALGGCQTVRSGLGGYQKAADKGIGIKGSTLPIGDTAVVVGGTTSPSGAPIGTVAENDNGAPSAADAGTAKTKKSSAMPVLPGGLIGDTANHAYSSTPKP